MLRCWSRARSPIRSAPACWQYSKASNFPTSKNHSKQGREAEKTSNKTVIIVAQRISTILHADQIIVLDEGRIVGIGTHKELIKNNEVYQQIAMSQLSKEELEDE